MVLVFEGLASIEIILKVHKYFFKELSAINSYLGVKG